jgi:hypothetical protein
MTLISCELIVDRRFFCNYVLLKEDSMVHVTPACVFGEEFDHFSSYVPSYFLDLYKPYLIVTR